MTRPMPGPPEYWWYCTPPHGEPGLWTSDMDPAEYMPFTHLQHKRLTDAECAAHYWQADGECLALDNALIVGWSNHETVTNADTRAETWKRFMDTTHALEEA